MFAYTLNILCKQLFTMKSKQNREHSTERQSAQVSEIKNVC